MVQEDRRSFEVGTDGDNVRTLYIGLPSSEQIRKADWHYSKVYNKALVEGIATEAEMLGILTERGIVGPEYDSKKKQLQVEIAAKLTLLETEQDEKERAALALNVRELRNELYLLSQKMTGPLSNTCEQMANDAKMEYLTSVVVQDESGKLLWKDYDAFLQEPDQRLSVAARYEVLLWMEGLEHDFLENTPENLVLKDIADKHNKKTEDTKQLKESSEVSEEGTKEEKPAKTPRKKSASKQASKKTQ